MDDPTLTPELIVAILPALLSPIVVWVLGRPTASVDAARIDYLSKRLDLITRLAEIRRGGGEGDLASLIDSETYCCRLFLSHKPRFIRSMEERDARALTKAGRFFLIATSLTLRQRIFKGLFFLFLCFSILPPLGFFVLAMIYGHHYYWKRGLATFTIYLGLAILSRFAARSKQTAQKS